MTARHTTRDKGGKFAPATARVAHPQERIAGDVARAVAGALAGGRLSIDTVNQFLGGGPLVLLPPPDPQGAWRTWQLDANAWATIPPHKLAEILADIEPEFSRALFMFLRLANPGWTCVVTRPGSDAPWPQGQAALDAFLATLVQRHGSVDVIFNRSFIAAFLRGAYMIELVLDEAGRVPLDIATPDPATARFRRNDDPTLGIEWELGQFQYGRFVALNVPTIRYLPIDPFPGSPYGRSLAAAGTFDGSFALGLKHDLRRVIAQAGYPHVDVTINYEALKKYMPEALWSDPTEYDRWVQAIAKQVTTALQNLQPNEAYVHSEIITVTQTPSALDHGVISGAVTLLKEIAGSAGRALKSNPVIMGENGIRGGEANANRQWEVNAAVIKAFQHPLEALFGHFFQLALRVQGLQADVTLRFAELRTAELYRDAQVAQLNIVNASLAYLAGWISQDEAAHMGIGKDQADVPEPRGPIAAPGGAGNAGTGAASGTNPDPGSNRGAAHLARTSAPLVMARMTDPTTLAPVPASVDLGATAQRHARQAWLDAFKDEDEATILDATVEEEDTPSDTHP